MFDLGNRYQFLKMCNFNDNDSCSHDYYVVYNKDDISELVFIAEEQRSELHAFVYINLYLRYA